MQHVRCPTVFTRYHGLAAQWQIKLLTIFTHPTNLASRNTNHQGIVWNVTIHYGSSTNESEGPDSDPAYNRTIRTQRRPTPYKRIQILIFSLDQGTRVVHIGEHHARPAEHPLFKSNIVIYRNIILYFAVITDNYLITDKDILPQRNARSNASTCANMDKMPDAGACANLRAVVNDRTGVLIVIHCLFTRSGLRWHENILQLRSSKVAISTRTYLIQMMTIQIDQVTLLIRDIREEF